MLKIHTHCIVLQSKWTIIGASYDECDGKQINGISPIQLQFKLLTIHSTFKEWSWLCQLCQDAICYTCTYALLIISHILGTGYLVMTTTHTNVDNVLYAFFEIVEMNH